MKKQKIYERAVTFILTRKNEELRNLEAEKIAASIKANRVYLCRSFKSHMKISIPDFILREKINRAGLILEKYPEKLINELSMELGFLKVEDFIMEFARHFAIEPGRYRDLRKEANRVSN